MEKSIIDFPVIPAGHKNFQRKFKNKKCACNHGILPNGDECYFCNGSGYVSNDFVY